MITGLSWKFDPELVGTSHSQQQIWQKINKSHVIMTTKKSSKSWAQNLIRLVSSLKNYSSKVCLHYLFWIQKLKSYNSDYRCYAKNMSNYKNIAKSSKKIGVNFWPRPEHKMTPTALWLIYLKLLPRCSKIQSTGKTQKFKSGFRFKNEKFVKIEWLSSYPFCFDEKNCKNILIGKNRQNTAVFHFFPFRCLTLYFDEKNCQIIWL